MAIASEIRGPGLLGQHAVQEYRALERGEPLVLTREPHNPIDPNAVIARTVMLVPCGYVAKEHAALIAREMDLGNVWVAKVTAPRNAITKPQVTLMRPGRAFYNLCREWDASARQAKAIMEGRFLRPAEEMS